MALDLSDTTLATFPHAFINRRGEPVVIKTLDPKDREPLVRMYLAYQPRDSFAGLPPLRDDDCVRWVQGMQERGANLIALSFQAGVAGHAALFPVDGETCEYFLVVAPAHQRLGIGTELTRCAVQAAHELGFERVWASVEAANQVARRVCRKCGFRSLPQTSDLLVNLELDLEHYRDATDVPVRQIMARPAVSIHESESAEDALQRFLETHIATLPVVNDHGQLAGILSETDLLIEASLRKRVGDLCTHDVVTLTEDCTLAKAIRLFHSRRLRCIPVVDAHRRPIGVVGRREILAHYASRLPARDAEKRMEPQMNADERG